MKEVHLAKHQHAALVAPEKMLDRFCEGAGWRLGEPEGGALSFVTPEGWQILISGVYEHYTEYCYLLSGDVDPVVREFVMASGLAPGNPRAQRGIYVRRAAHLLRDANTTDALRHALTHTRSYRNRVMNISWTEIVRIMLGRALGECDDDAAEAIVLKTRVKDLRLEHYCAPVRTYPTAHADAGDGNVLTAMYAGKTRFGVDIGGMQLSYAWQRTGRDLGASSTSSLCFNQNFHPGATPALVTWLYAMIALTISPDVAERALVDISLEQI